MARELSIRGVPQSGDLPGELATEVAVYTRNGSVASSIMNIKFEPYAERMCHRDMQLFLDTVFITTTLENKRTDDDPSMSDVVHQGDNQNNKSKAKRQKGAQVR